MGSPKLTILSSNDRPASVVKFSSHNSLPIHVGTVQSMLHVLCAPSVLTIQFIQSVIIKCINHRVAGVAIVVIRRLGQMDTLVFYINRELTMRKGMINIGLFVFSLDSNHTLLEV